MMKLWRNYIHDIQQQSFNLKLVVEPQIEYKAQKIDWNYVDFGLDSQPTISLLENVSFHCYDYFRFELTRLLQEEKKGILDILRSTKYEEEVGFVTLLASLFTKNSVEGNTSHRLEFSNDQLQFGFHHHAGITIFLIFLFYPIVDYYMKTGAVWYNIKDWAKKIGPWDFGQSSFNFLKDSIDLLVVNLFSEGITLSSPLLIPFVYLILIDLIESAPTSFSTLDSSQILRDSKYYFVRCVLANKVQKPDSFDSTFIFNQLQYMGILYSSTFNFKF